jgi:hypothetical protein
MQLLFSNAYINISLHPGPPHNTIEIQWLDFVPSADFRACMRQMLHLAQLHQVKGWWITDSFGPCARPTWLGQAPRFWYQ